MNGTSPDPQKIESYLKGARERFEDRLAHLVEIPTISMDPARRPDIERGAQAAADLLRECGAVAEVVPTSGNPVVVGEFRAGTLHPTLTIYNHMDVQPAQEPEWKQEPFHFRKEEGRYFGRGTTDDKGPALTALFAAKYAAENGVRLNIRFVWELEEEIGSPHFEEFIKGRLASLETDSVLVSDTIWLSRGKPAIPYGLRGMKPARLMLRTGGKDAHSGLTGGAARNPIGELAALITRLYDARTGQVKIPGFYKDVVRPSAKEVKSFQSSGFDLKKFQAAHELKSLRTKNPREVMLRIWASPTFEVHGIAGGYQGPGVKTVVPPWAEAKISMRLVPKQDPRTIFALLKKAVAKVNKDVEVIEESGLGPYLGPFTGPYADAAREALRFGFGATPAFIREGGSIGAVVTMERYLKAPIMLIGLSLPEHGYHAPNENYDWGQASGGIKSFVKYFSDIAGLRRG
ncbi:MAG TPA: M20/M25/M40 family metallo-hydrolase [Candidatus Polarisedimenticolia bacterium]|nr:M20/M25/M40 family metallo-hydrolase [Candidatus Polarisedimenticolia bacterium]